MRPTQIRQNSKYHLNHISMLLQLIHTLHSQRLKQILVSSKILLLHRRERIPQVKIHALPLLLMRNFKLIAVGVDILVQDFHSQLSCFWVCSLVTRGLKLGGGYLDDEENEGLADFDVVQFLLLEIIEEVVDHDFDVFVVVEGGFEVDDTFLTLVVN